MTLSINPKIINPRKVLESKKNFTKQKINIKYFHPPKKTVTLGFRFFNSMKKVLIPLLALLLNFSFFSLHAQSSTTKKASSTQKETIKTKKDGTPDMRFKENKENAKPAPKHLKKDGTPDKRFSENKK
jgi:hypothetical protein